MRFQGQAQPRSPWPQKACPTDVNSLSERMADRLTETEIKAEGKSSNCCSSRLGQILLELATEVDPTGRLVRPFSPASAAPCACARVTTTHWTCRTARANLLRICVRIAAHRISRAAGPPWDRCWRWGWRWCRLCWRRLWVWPWCRPWCRLCVQRSTL